MTLLSAGVVIAAVVIVAAIVAASSLGAAKTVTHTTAATTPTTSVVQTTGPASSTSVVCIQTGIHGLLFVRVVTSDIGQPIEGADVNATITDYCTPGYPIQLGLTNSTGYTLSGVGWTGGFIVSVAYGDEVYTFPAQTSGAVSLVILSVPSGVVVERTIACYGIGCQNDTTTATASSVSMPGKITSVNSTQCYISGQPGGIFIRILSDTNQTPVGGALVRATNDPAYCGNSPATERATQSFTTSPGTEWYSLNPENSAGYSFVVIYSGQTYTFTASLRPVSVTCITLYVPSGGTNATVAEFQTTC